MRFTESLLQINPLILIGIFSLIISLLINLIYKFTTNQELMKKLKEEIKESQQEMKKLRDNPKKMTEVQKKAMEKNLVYMKHSFKPTLYTFIPLILIFSWFNGHLAYAPLLPNQTFNVVVYSDYHVNLSTVPELEIVNEEKIKEGSVFTLKGEAGYYTMWYDADGDRVSQDIMITEKQEYEKPLVKFKNSKIKSAEVSHEKLMPFGDFSLFGWHPGWVGTYIIFSLVFSMFLRKIMKIY